MKNNNPPVSRSVLALALTFAFGNSAYPQIYAYSANSGNWGSAATWNTPPVDGLQAVVTGGDTVTFGPGDSYTGNPGWWAGLGVGGGAGLVPAGREGAGTLNITGGTLTSGAMWTGHGGTGTINLSGGTLNIGGQHMLFGWNFGSTLNVSGGTLNMTGSDILFNFGHTAACGLTITNTGVANLTGGISVQSASQININDGGSLSISNTLGQQVTVQSGSAINQTAGATTVTGDNGLWLGANTSTGTINLSGGTWQQNGYLRFGVYGAGSGFVNQSGGTFEMGEQPGSSFNGFHVWASPGSANGYNLNGGTFRTIAPNLNWYVTWGNDGSGTPGVVAFNITGSSGNVTMDTLYDFTAPNSHVFNNASATLTKTGAGKLETVSLDVRNGALDMQAGKLELVNNFFIGSYGGSATGTMSGGMLESGRLGGGNFSVGAFGGTGTFTQSGGTNDVGSLANVVIGWNAGTGAGTGTYQLNGGTFSASNNITFVGIGSGAAGTLNVTNAACSGYDTRVGQNSATGTVNINNGGSMTTTKLIVGWDANGTVNVNSGGSVTVTDTDVWIGLYGFGNGTLNLNGGSFSGGATHVGYDTTGTGTVNLSSGSLTASSLHIGDPSAAGGTLNLNGGTLSTPGDVSVRKNGTVNINSGGSMPAANVSVTEGGLIYFNGGTGNASMNLLLGSGGTVDVNGHSLAAGNWANLVASGPGGILRNSSATAATIANGNTLWLWDGGTNLMIETSGGDLQIDSWITSALQTTRTGIIKTGAYTLVLTHGGNDYTGVTQIDAGTLRLGASDTLPDASDVILSGGTLDADGATDTAASLTVSANSTLALGTGSLMFGNSSGKAWSGTLTLTGTLGPNSLWFPDGLTSAQVQSMAFNGKRVYLSKDGHIVDYPPGTLITLH